MKKQVTVAIAGLGNRGRHCYAACSTQYGDEIKIAAVADINEERLAEAAKTYGIPEDKCFKSAEEMLEREKLADAMFICTPDACHGKQAVSAIEKGYHLLLEKPVSPDREECDAILAAAKKHKRHVVVCHVLRYTPFYKKLKELVDANTIGEIVTVQAIENVGYYHQAHSFVRGNWRNSGTSSPMILQKCCHDMDILLWLTGKRVKSVSSYGSLSFFKRDKAPEGYAERCLDGCKARDNCPYDAYKIYVTDRLTGVTHGKTGWPNNVLTLEPTEESILNALKTGPYGRCVYACDNNVVDHQVVNMLLDDGVTVSFTMSGLTAKQFRHTKLMGALGEIEADMDKNLIMVSLFGKEPELIDVAKLAKDFSGHAGGDTVMVKEFIDLLLGKNKDNGGLTTIERSMDSHYACFAAEKSRLKGGAAVDITDPEISAGM